MDKPAQPDFFMQKNQKVTRYSSKSDEILQVNQQNNSSIQKYIKDIAQIIQIKIGKENLHALAIFGSATYDKMTQHSDVDLLIVISNNLSYRQIRKIKPYLEAIEIKNNFEINDNRWDARITRAIDRATGMFCSHFICRLEDWENHHFSHIFNTNPIITKILAPTEIVLNSMKDSAHLLLGDLNLTIRKTNYSSLLLIKSMVMCLSLGFGALLILPLDSNNMKYVLEAYKWSLRTCYFYIYQKAVPLKQVTQKFKKLEFFNGYLTEFIHLRQQPRLNLLFAIRLPWQIVKIHILTMKYKRNL